MRQVTDRAEFDRGWATVEKYVHLDRGIHQGPFRIAPHRTFFIQFAEFKTGNFFVDLRHFANRLRHDEITIATLAPHPVSDFYKDFGQFHMLISKSSDLGKDFLTAINEAPPGGNIAASIRHAALYIAAFSKIESWFVFGDWNFDTIAVSIFDPAIEPVVRASFKLCPFLKLHDRVEFFWRWNDVRVDEEFMRKHYNPAM